MPSQYVYQHFHTNQHYGTERINNLKLKFTPTQLLPHKSFPSSTDISDGMECLQLHEFFPATVIWYSHGHTNCMPLCHDVIWIVEKHQILALFQPKVYSTRTNTLLIFWYLAPTNQN